MALRRQLNDQAGSAAVLYSLACVQFARGQLDRARELFEEGLDVFTTLQTNKLILAAAIHNMGAVALEQGHLTEARRRLEQSLQLSRDLGSRQVMAQTLYELGRVARLSGDPAQAAELLDQSLQLCGELGDAQIRASVSYEQSILARIRGDLHGALALSRGGLAGCGPDGEWSAVVGGLESVAGVLVALGRLEAAAQLYGAAAAVRQRQGTPVLPSARTAYESDLQELRSRWGVAFAAVWAAGAAMTRGDAVAYALASSSS